MALLVHLNELDQLIPVPSTTRDSIQPDPARWDQQTHQLEQYIEGTSIDIMVEATAKVIVGHGISDQTMAVLTQLLKFRYYTEYDEDTGDLAGDILQQGLIIHKPGFHRVMIEKIHRFFGRFNIVTLEALLDQSDQKEIDKTIIYFAYRYALDQTTPEHIMIISDGDYPTQQQLYSSLKQVGQTGLPPLDPSLYSSKLKDGSTVDGPTQIPSSILLALEQKDPELVKHVATIIQLGHYREQLRQHGRLIQIMGPANPSKNCSFRPVFNQGGERMLFDYYYDPEEDEECTINIEWFIGQCENVDCLCPIEYFWQAKRIPMPNGGWRGCFCSFGCAKLAAADMEDEFHNYQEDGVDQMIMMGEDIYLPEGWSDLFDYMEEQLINHPIIPRDRDNDSIVIIGDVFTRLGYYLSQKYPHIDPNWFDQEEITPFLNYSEEDMLDLSAFPGERLSARLSINE